MSQKQPNRDWYSVSIASLRQALTFLAMVLMLIGGSVFYQRWQESTLEERAEQAIEMATLEIRKLESRDDFDKIRIEHSDAWEDLAAARAEFSAQRFGEALSRADNSMTVLARMSDIDPEESAEKIRFEEVQGGVEFRRGERGAWRRARVHDTLNYGDWVKTSSGGSAQIRFPDDSKYLLRPNTMVHLGSSRAASGGSEQVTDIVFGWVELNTTQSSSRVKTPSSEAEVRSSSEALVSYNQGKGEFAAYAGGMEVTSSNGQKREVRPLQKVSQVGDLLSEPVALPGQPQLLRPTPKEQVVFSDGSTLNLQWRAAARASSYALRISNTPLFTHSVVEDLERRKTSARLEARGPGEFFWQVAAVASDGARGPWSETRSFRLVPQQNASPEDDNTPPMLEIEDLRTWGRMVLVSGRTEADAKILINSEPVAVATNGSFSKVLQMKQEGFAFVEITATDPWENSQDLRRRVFIDTF